VDAMSQIFDPKVMEHRNLELGMSPTLAKYQGNLDAVRLTLANNPEDIAVSLECFNRSEAKWVYDALTPEQRMRVHFTWMTFGLESERRPLSEP
jgi:hypothetical protein